MSTSEELVHVGDNFYPKWAVEKAKRLHAMAAHLDLEKLIKAVIIARNGLENAPPADLDNDEPGVVSTPAGLIIRISKINR